MRVFNCLYQTNTLCVSIRSSSGWRALLTFGGFCARWLFLPCLKSFGKANELWVGNIADAFVEHFQSVQEVPAGLSRGPVNGFQDTCDMARLRRCSAAPLYEIQNLTAQQFVGGVEGGHFRNVIVILLPDEARTCAVALA
jgi:hypothetical protein